MSHQLEHRTVLVTGATEGSAPSSSGRHSHVARAACTPRLGPRGTGTTRGSSRCVSTSPIRHRSRRRPARPPTSTCSSNNAGIAPATDASIAGADRADPDGPVRDEHLRPDPGRSRVRAGARRERRRRGGQRPVARRVDSVAHRLRGVEGSRVVGHERAPGRARSAGDDRHPGDRGHGRHTDGRSVRRAEELCRERRGADVRRRRAAGAFEVLADADTRMVKSLLSRPAEELAAATEAAARAVVRLTTDRRRGSGPVRASCPSPAATTAPPPSGGRGVFPTRPPTRVDPDRRPRGGRLRASRPGGGGVPSDGHPPSPAGSGGPAGCSRTRCRTRRTGPRARSRPRSSRARRRRPRGGCRGSPSRRPQGTRRSRSGGGATR